MHLYIYSEFSKEIANITLRHGCCPCIGDQASDQLEPAIWFKVLVLDAISIDCNKRTVMWHTSTDLQSLKTEDDVLPKTVEAGQPKDAGDSVFDHKLAKKFGHRRSSSRRMVRRQISESVYAGGECMGYESDMDLVFDLAQKMLSEFASGEISQTDFNKAIFRILHIHILPKIRLSADDVINVQDAAAIIDGYIIDIDEMILAKQGKIDRVNQDSKKLRDRLISDMSEPDYCCKFSLTMAECLLEQVNEDLVSAQQQLERITQEVEAVKEVILSSGDSEDSSSISSSGEEDLSRLRQRRDKFLNDRFNKLLTSRAVLDDYIKTTKEGVMDESGNPQKPTRKSKTVKKKSKKSKRKSKLYAPTDEENPLHATYMGMEQTKHHLICEIQELAHKKVLQTSVKEAIRGVLQILLCGQETAGVDIDPTGTKCPTDVMRHSRIPMEWLSLAEQVATVIQDKNLTLSQAHELFCDKVREICNVALQKRKLSDLSVSIEHESQPPTLSPTHNGGLYAGNKLYNLKHGIKPSTSRDSERSSGFSSHCPSESDASRASNLTNRSCSYLTRESLQVKTAEPFSKGSNPEVSSSLPESSNELQLPSQMMFRGANSSGNFVRSTSEPSSLLDNSLIVHDPGSLLERSVDSATVDAADNTSTTENHEEYAILETSDVALIEPTDELEVAIEKLRVYVTSQFEEICIQLQDHLGFTGDVYYKKIWQCYETHFFGDTMDLISHLYVEAYAAKLKHFLDGLQSLTAADLDLNGFIINTLIDVGLNFKLEDIPEHPHNKRESDSSRLTGSTDSGSSPSGTVVTDGTATLSDHTLTPSDDCTGTMPDAVSTLSSSVLNDKFHHGSWDVIADCEVKADSPKDDKLDIALARLSNGSTKSSVSHHSMNHSMNLIKSQTRTLPESMKLDLTPAYMSSTTNSLGRGSTLEPPQDDLRKSKEIKSSSSSSENTSSTCTSSEGIKSTTSSDPSSSEQSLDAATEVHDPEEKPRIIRVSHPTTTNILCDRHTWPNILHDPLSEYNIVHEVATTVHTENASGQAFTSQQVIPVSPTVLARSKTTQFQKDILNQFQEAFDTIDQALKDASPLHKLQQLVRCLKEINRQYQALQLDLCGEKSIGACADELIDILVLFLCNCNIDVAQKLYAQITMLTHFLPRFFEGGPFSFTLVQFLAAFQVLQDRLLIKSKKTATESDA